MKIKHTTWNLKALAAGDKDPAFALKRKATKAAIERFAKKWQAKTDYLKDPVSLARALKEYEALEDNRTDIFGDELFYFHLRTMQESNNPKLKASFNLIVEFAHELEDKLRFFGLNIAKIKPELQPKFLKHPKLQPYHHFLAKTFSQAKYLLSDKEEKIMSLKSGPAHYNWAKMVEGFLAKETRLVPTEKGTKQILSFEELSKNSYSRKKVVRQASIKAVDDIFRSHVEAAEAEMNSILENKKIDDDIRGFSRPDASRHLSDDIEPETVGLLLEAVSKNYKIAHRFYALKAKLLGFKKLEYPERNMNYGRAELKFEYEKAVDLVHKVLKNLDQEFGEIFEDFIAEGRIDFFPRQSKHGGAFCITGSKYHKPYILLNHTHRLRDVTTLAHEMGHGINGILTRRHQNAFNYAEPMSTAEVASTFMEDFVLQEIAAKANPELKLTILISKLDDDIASIFRQVAAYSFERELHEQFRKVGYLSHQDIGKLFTKHMASYLGPAVKTEGADNWWLHWSHFRSPFYVYSYASGLLISKALQAGVKKDPAFIKQVKGFLSAGSSDSPKNIFAKLGVDISSPKFWQDGLLEVAETLNEAEKLAKKLGKI